MEFYGKMWKEKKNGKSFRIFFSIDFSRKLQEYTYVPEYSGIFLIYSIERSSPSDLQRNFDHNIIILIIYLRE